MIVNPVTCAGCKSERDESDVCQDGYCRECHVSLTFEECCDGSWVDAQRVAAGLPAIAREQRA